MNDKKKFQQIVDLNAVKSRVFPQESDFQSEKVLKSRLQIKVTIRIKICVFIVKDRMLFRGNRLSPLR